MKNKKANITLYLTFIIFAIIIIVVTAVVAPFGVRLNAEAYAMGEKILISTNESIQNINNSDVRLSIQRNINNSLDSIETNLEVNNSLFQYSWLIVIILVGIMLFIFTRSLVELNRFGGGGLY